MKSGGKEFSFIEIPAPQPFRPVKYHLLCKEGGKIRESRINKNADFNFSSLVIATLAHSSGPLPYMFEEYRDHYDSFPKVFCEVVKSAIKKIRWQMTTSRDRVGVFFDTRCSEPNNVTHLMIEVIPLILTIKRALGPGVDFIFYKVGDRFLELLNYFDIQPKLSAKRFVGNRVALFAKQDFKLVPFEPRACDLWFLRFFPDVYKGCIIKKTLTVPRVFVARKNTRAFTNENEMERFLSKFGFQKFYLEELAIEDQISLMAHAEYVVGAMGAAFGYLALNPSLKGVVEVSVPHSFDEFLAGVLSFKTDHYVTILPEFDLKKVLAPWECRMREKSSNFRVDLAFLEKSMEVFGLEPR